MRRIVPAILLLVVLVVGGSLIADTSYQAGLSAAATTTASGTTVVVPAAGYGFGWHLFGAGFGFLGFLGTLFFLFIVFALIRAVVFGFGRRGHHGWGPGMREAYRARWETGSHETFDDWHRRAHGEPPKPTDAAGPAPTDRPS